MYIITRWKDFKKDMNFDLTVFLSEMFATLFLTLVALSTPFIIKKFGLTGYKAHAMTATVISIGLILGVIIALGFADMTSKTDAAYGFVNPGPALMIFIRDNTYDNALAAIAGTFVGGIAGGLLHGLALKVLPKIKGVEYAGNLMAEGNVEVNAPKSIISELFGAGLFFGALVFITKLNPIISYTLDVNGDDVMLANAGNIPLYVGMALFVAIIATGNYSAMLNPAVGLGFLISQLISGKKPISKLSINYLISAASNFAMAGIIGGIAFGITKM